MTFTVSRVPVDQVPPTRARLGERWEQLKTQLLAAHAAGEAIRVQPISNNDAGNFLTAMRKRGIKVSQRKVADDTFVFIVTSVERPK